MPAASDPAPAECPGNQAFKLLARRWNTFIVWALLDGPRRFGDLLGIIDGVSERMLTQRLRELEEAGLVTRHRYREAPPRVEYRLTEAGEALKPIIEAMEEWSTNWVGGGRLAHDG